MKMKIFSAVLITILIVQFSLSGIAKTKKVATIGMLQLPPPPPHPPPPHIRLPKIFRGHPHRRRPANPHRLRLPPHPNRPSGPPPPPRP